MPDDNEELYHVKIIRRDFQGQTSDDYHATVTRISDGKQIVLISAWKWFLKLRTRRRLLDREYNYYDKREKKLAKTDEFRR
jgi:hypothetical protein